MTRAKARASEAPASVPDEPCVSPESPASPDTLPPERQFLNGTKDLCVVNALAGGLDKAGCHQEASVVASWGPETLSLPVGKNAFAYVQHKSARELLSGMKTNRVRAPETLTASDLLKPVERGQVMVVNVIDSDGNRTHALSRTVSEGETQYIHDGNWGTMRATRANLDKCCKGAKVAGVVAAFTVTKNPNSLKQRRLNTNTKERKRKRDAESAPSGEA